jgi:DNA-directed RNA polymerase specialized sigma24 family protein
MRGQSWERRVDGGRLPGHRLDDADQDAARRLQACAAALGAERVELLRLHLVDDIAWSALGARLGCCSRTARGRTVAALEALAAWRTGIADLRG